MTDNKAIIRSFFDALQSQGLGVAVQKYGTPDFVWWAAGLGEVQEKADQIGSIVGQQLDANGMRLEMLNMTSEGNRVAVEAEAFATLKSGVKYNNHYHFLFFLHDGKVRKMKEYHDTQHAAEVWGEWFSAL